MVGYEVEGTVVQTLKEVAGLLGEEKVTKKDINEGGKYHGVVNLVDMGEEDLKMNKKPELKSEKQPKKESKKDTEEVYTALSEEDMESLAEADPKEIEESFPKFESLEELKEVISDLDTTTLEYLATGMQLEWNPTYHKNIHRMRIAVAIQKHFFPEKFKKTPKENKAKYGDYSTDELFKMAEENNIEVKRSGNEKIDRLQVITKLKKDGHLE